MVPSGRHPVQGRSLAQVPAPLAAQVLCGVLDNSCDMRLSVDMQKYVLVQLIAKGVASRLQVCDSPK